MPNTETGNSDSHSRTFERFDREAAAGKYPSEFGTSIRARRERVVVRKIMSRIPRGSRVLDLPCGTGRLLPDMLARDFEVTEADSSAHMIERARQHQCASDSIRFAVADALNTGFDDDEFDAVLCFRLFHHFSEPSIRTDALRELRRICKGPVVVSYFDAFAVDALRFKWKHFRRGTTPNDRIPIAHKIFARDIEDAGLRVVESDSVLWGLSPLRYVTLESATKVAQKAA